MSHAIRLSSGRRPAAERRPETSEVTAPVEVERTDYSDEPDAPAPDAEEQAWADVLALAQRPLDV